MNLRIYLIVEEGADRVFVQTSHPKWYSGSGRVLSVDVPLPDVERVNGRITLTLDHVVEMSAEGTGPRGECLCAWCMKERAEWPRGRSL